MEDNTRDVLSALVTVAGGFTTAHIVANVVAGRERRLEADRDRHGGRGERSGPRDRRGQQG